MRTNISFTSAMAIAMAASPVAAALAPSTALAADWDNSLLATSVQMKMEIKAEGNEEGTDVTVTVTSIATKNCGKFTVKVPILTDDLEEQGFKLVIEGPNAPQSLPQGPTVVPVTPLLSSDGKALMFTVDSLSKDASQICGISYTLHSDETYVKGSAEGAPALDENSTEEDYAAAQAYLEQNSLYNWAVQKTESMAWAHFPNITASVEEAQGATPVENQGDAYAEGNITVTIDTQGAGDYEPITVSKKAANALLTQLPSPKRDGYKLAGWALDKDGQTMLTAETIPSEDFTAYAVWEVDDTKYGTSSQTTETKEAANSPGSTKYTGDGTKAATNSSAAKSTSSGSGSSSKKSDLANAGATDEATIIVAGLSVASGIAVIALRKRS